VSWPVGITVGSDGALWFAELSSNQIGRITVDGTITHYSLLNDQTDPYAIAAGPNGSLWYKKSNYFNTVPSLIGELTASGTAIDYPASANYAGAITAGPDGAMWFADVDAVRRITTSGTVTNFPVASVPGQPAAVLGIVTGPDGALWFTEGFTNKIGRITTSGTMTEYPLPANFGPASITNGPDGALWFAGNGGLGRITTAGVVTVYPEPVVDLGIGLPSLATGSDGALWLTVPGGNSIVRAAPNSAPPVAVSVTPNAGAGSTQVFTFRFSHPVAYENLDVLDVLINNSLDGRNACYLAYSVQSNTLQLVDDGGDSGGPFAGSFTLGNAGESNTIRNSQCAVTLTSAAGSGTDFTLTVDITFQPGFAGNRVAYLAARDLGGGNSGWQALATWQVPASTPPGGTILVTGSSGAAQPFTVTIADSNGASDLGVVNVLINNSVDGRNACYLAYVPPMNTLILIDDAGDSQGPYAGSMLLNGQAATIQNSQCAVNAVGSSASSPAGAMTLTLNLTMQPEFKGNHIVYAAGRDLAGGNNTGWQAVGTWAVQ